MINIRTFLSKNGVAMRRSACCRTSWNMALKHFESLEWSRLFLNNFCRGHPVVFCLQYMDFFIQSDTTYFLKAMPNLVFLNNFVMTFVCWPSYVNVAPSCFWFCLCIESFFFLSLCFCFGIYLEMILSNIWVSSWHQYRAFSIIFNSTNDCTILIVLLHIITYELLM